MAILTALDSQRASELEVARVLAGDRDAMADLYRRWSGPVYAYVRTIVVDHHDAEDATQQVFLKLMRVLPSYDARRARFSAWLLRVARNTAIDTARRRRRTVASDPHGWWPQAAAPDREPLQSLEEALAALTPRQRQVLLLRELIGLTPHEVAGRLSATDGAVHTLHHRARLAACARLSGMGAAPVCPGRKHG